MSGASSTSLLSMAEILLPREPAVAISASSCGPAAAGAPSSHHIQTDASSSGSHAAAASSSSSGSLATAAGSSSHTNPEPGPSASHDAISPLLPLPGEGPLIADLAETMDHIAALKAKLDWHKAKMRESIRGGGAVVLAEKKEEKPLVFSEADVPGFIEDLASPEDAAHNKAAFCLGRIAETQQDIVHSAVIQHLPYILSLLQSAPSDARTGSLIHLIHQIGCASLDAQHTLRKYIDLEEVIKLLLKPNPEFSCIAIRSSTLRLLDNLMQRLDGNPGEVNGMIESQVVEILHMRLYKFETLEDENAEKERGKSSGKGKAKAPETLRWNTDDAFNAVKTLEFALKHRATSFCVASLKAGAMEFLLQIATTPSFESSAAGGPGSTTTLSALRVAAVDCLSELYVGIVEQYIMPEDLPHIPYQEDARFDLQGRILMPLLDIIDDADLPVSDKIVQLLYRRFNDLDQAVEIFLWTHEGGMEKLIRKLALGSAGGGESDRETRNRPRSGLMDMLLGPLASPGKAGQGGHKRLPSAAELLAMPFPPGVGGNGEGGFASFVDNPASPASLPSATIAKARDSGEVEASITTDKEPSPLQSLGEAVDAKVSKEQGGDDVEMMDMGDEKDVGAKTVVEGRSSMVEAWAKGRIADFEAKGKGVATEPAESKDEDEKMAPPIHKRSFAEMLSMMGDVPAIPHKTPRPGPFIDLGVPKLGLSDRLLSMLDRIGTTPRAELLFQSLIDHNPDGIREAFATFWAKEDVEESVREGLVRALTAIHGSVRVIAESAGVPVPPECAKKREEGHESSASGAAGNPIGAM